MIYLDYAATTPVNDQVLETFNDIVKNYPGNANTHYLLGSNANDVIIKAGLTIRKHLQVDHELIYTASASEANNLAIKGVALHPANKKKHIITTKLGHSSTYGPLGYLQSLGYVVDIIDFDENGQIDLEKLKAAITDDTFLITVNAVNSELGIIEPIDELIKIGKEHNVLLHVDATQAIGKIKLDFNDIDLISMSSHKIFGLNGIGLLMKKDNVKMIPLIHGGKSTTIYRSGTPTQGLIASLAKAIELVYTNIDDSFVLVTELKSLLINYFNGLDHIVINDLNGSPYILNISVTNNGADQIINRLYKEEIYLSTQSACASGSTMSNLILDLFDDEIRAKNSMRISLSKITTTDEINQFIKIFDQIYQEVNNENS